MANRMFFISPHNSCEFYKEEYVEFEYFSGFALSQKQKCIESLHKSIERGYSNLNTLEISTKSTVPIGVALSAFNLKLYNRLIDKEVFLENIFQSSKVFTEGGPYEDLLDVSPKDAKRDIRLKASGELVYFSYQGVRWPIEPKTIFYDWLYICALSKRLDLRREIMTYTAFTDIEFNHKKSINCQARSAAIFVSLERKGLVNEYISDIEKFKKIYNGEDEMEQMTLF